MIKYMNDGEINRLKKGFYKTLALKKINILDNNRFINMELDLEKAIKIYKAIVALNIPYYYAGSSTIMLDYLYIYGILEEKDYDSICDKFFDYSCDSNDDEIDYLDYWDERSDFISDFMKRLSYKKGISIYSESFSDIYSCNVIDDVYEDTRKSLRDCSRDYETDENDEDDLIEDYFSIFQDDAISYVLEDYEINENDLMLLNNTFNDVDSGVRSEVYTYNGHTYINISSMQVLEGIDYSFLIILKLIFMNI